MRSAVQQIMDVSTKQSLTPTVEMNFEEMTGDKTVPIVPAPVSQEAGEETVQRNVEPVQSEFKTEVLPSAETTGGKQEAETPPIAPFVGQDSGSTTGGQQTSAGTIQEEPKKRGFLWLLIPVGALVLFLIGGVIAGGAYYISQMDGDDPSNSNVDGANTSGTPGATPDTTPESTPDLMPTPDTTTSTDSTPESTPSTNPTATPRKTATPRPTRKATPRKTPRKTPKKTPRKTPRRTPRKTPKKNLDCIFTDSC